MCVAVHMLSAVQSENRAGRLDRCSAGVERRRCGTAVTGQAAERVTETMGTQKRVGVAYVGKRLNSLVLGIRMSQESGLETRPTDITGIQGERELPGPETKPEFPLLRKGIGWV